MNYEKIKKTEIKDKVQWHTVSTYNVRAIIFISNSNMQSKKKQKTPRKQETGKSSKEEDNTSQSSLL